MGGVAGGDEVGVEKVEDDDVDGVGLLLSLVVVVAEVVLGAEGASGRVVDDLDAVDEVLWIKSQCKIISMSIINKSFAQA